MSNHESIGTRIKVRYDTGVNRSRLNRLTSRVKKLEQHVTKDKGRVVVFNASTRLGNVSLNASFSLLMAWGLRLSGWQVEHFVCQAGMSRCLLGSSEDDADQEPPCKNCIALSEALYNGADATGFRYQRDPQLASLLEGKNVAELSGLVYHGIPLGEIVLPSIRWRMRRYHLEENQTTRKLFREFILSAYHVGKEFGAFLDQKKPDAVIVFNGQMFPEAIARRMAEARRIKVLSHETGLQPYTVFVTSQDATARRVYLNDAERQLTASQNERLDTYLEQRFQGKFSMAGIEFWKQMEGLPEEVRQKIEHFDQVVPVFTNVIFDTSQAHANLGFPHMFEWLDATLEIIRDHPETLFILRAHPDEMRPNSDKKSRETVRQWVEDRGAADLPNVLYIDSLEYISSYALIEAAKFILAYNSSVALESVLFGKLPVCAGWAWYADYTTGIFPQSPEEYKHTVEELLASEKNHLPEDFRQNARSLLYYQNFRSSLPFGKYLEPHQIRGYVRLKSFDPFQLSSQEDISIRSLIEGIEQDDLVISLPED